MIDTCFATDNLRVGLNDGTGQFTLSDVEPLTGACHSFTTPNGVALGYFDDDTSIDLAYVSKQTASVRLLLNQGNGTFVPGDTIATEIDPVDVYVGDIDGNGSDDLLSANLTMVATQGSVTTIPNNQCSPWFSQRVLGDDNGFSWSTELTYLGVRGSFTAATEISGFAFDRQFAATGTQLDDSESPLPGEGFWYLVRPECVSTSWTSGGLTEVVGRDALLP